MIRVLIVDDHTALCTLFKNAFGEHEDFTVIGELSDANLAYSFCKYKIPDIMKSIPFSNIEYCILTSSFLFHIKYRFS